MNEKTCRKARKLARQFTPGKPEAVLVSTKANKGTAFYDMNSTRGVYKAIKRAIRAGVKLKQITMGSTNAQS